MVKKTAEVINNDLVSATLRGFVGIGVAVGAWFSVEIYSLIKGNERRLDEGEKSIAQLEERSKHTNATLDKVDARQRRIYEKLTEVLMLAKGVK